MAERDSEIVTLEGLMRIALSPSARRPRRRARHDDRKRQREGESHPVTSSPKVLPPLAECSLNAKGMPNPNFHIANSCFIASSRLLL
jgi:hypothetical protein